MVETSAFLSVIDSAVVKQKQDTRNALITTAAVISLLLVLLVIALIILRRKMNLLQQSNVQLKQLNEQIQESEEYQKVLNGKLGKANKIKEEYITRFMHLCLDYIDKMEKYRAHLNKVAR